MKITLIGFMGSGKTSVAQQLGHLLRLPVLEMDDLILKKTNAKNMHEAFAIGGELLIREKEIEIAKEYSTIDNTIISSGGGIVMNKIVLDYLKMTFGKVVFLNASFSTIACRLADDKLRPLFSNIQDVEALYRFRLPLYLKYSDQVIETDGKTVDRIAEEIVGGFKHGK